jgi:hypothetical protein
LHEHLLLLLCRHLQVIGGNYAPSDYSSLTLKGDDPPLKLCCSCLSLLLLLPLQVIGGNYATTDYSSLTLKGDHFNRPLWVCSDGRIFLETYSPIYKQVC